MAKVGRFRPSVEVRGDGRLSGTSREQHRRCQSHCRSALRMSSGGLAHGVPPHTEPFLETACVAQLFFGCLSEHQNLHQTVCRSVYIVFRIGSCAERYVVPRRLFFCCANRCNLPRFDWSLAKRCKNLGYMNG